LASIETICRSQSALSDVQIHILKNSEELLQFASDLSHRELLVFVPGRKEETLILAAHCIPLLQQIGDTSGKVSVGTVFAGYEEPIALRVLQTGQAMQGSKEIEYGHIEPLFSYPFVDNAGETIAVISFVGKVESNRDILTETAFLALQVPIEKDFRKLYCRLSVQDGVVLINCNGVIIYADEMADSIMHMRGHSGPLVGSNIYNTQTNLTGAKQALATHEGFVEDVTFGTVVFTRRVIPLLQRGKVHRVIAILTERTELYRKEEELMIKTSVIKEIHHRVKNNLQTIASLLRMQMRRTESQEAKDVLKESLNRILSIALVHETLSHHDEENIDISDVAKKLLLLLTHSLVSADCHVESSFSGETLFLPSDETVSLALVLNELITNAIIHGFEGQPAGKLDIMIENKEKHCTITVTDDGIGMEQSKKEDSQRKHLGMEIVRTLIEKDLKGTLEFTKGDPKGTKVCIIFPVAKGGN
jgi:two-component sensor histidine kinase